MYLVLVDVMDKSYDKTLTDLTFVDLKSLKFRLRGRSMTTWTRRGG